MPTTRPAFHAYCDGFELTSADRNAIQAFIDARKQDSKGKVLKLFQGVDTGYGFLFDGTGPRREAVL